MFEKIKNVSLEKIFVLMALFFGLLYVFILPPFQSVDEGAHFYRTYQISSGKFIAHNIDGKVGDVLPQSLSDFYNLYKPFIKDIDKKTGIENIKRDFQIKVEEDKTVYTEFVNTALYSPVCYISQIPGVIAGKILNLPLAGIYYLGRMCNLIAYCLLVFLAIRITPFFKMPMMLLALMPMSLSLAGAYTCDVAVLGFNFLWIAMILKVLTSDCAKKKDIAVMAVLAFLIALTKSYVLLLPLIFLLPTKIFKTKKQYFLNISVIILSIIVAGSIWYACSKGLKLNMGNMGANPDVQIALIKSHPFNFIGVLIKTFFVKTPRLFITMIGVLGWQDVKLDWITYFIYPVLIYFSIVADKFNFCLEKWQKLIILFTIILGTVLTYTSLYIMWTSVGNSVVMGLNGKYFIPLMLPLLLLFKKCEGKYDYDKVKLFIIVALFLILLSSELSLLHRFYNITPQLYYKI